MSIETILIIATIVFGLFFLFCIGIAAGGIFLWIINKTVVSEAVKNAKPTSINHGITINHNYGQENKSDEKIVEDETALLASKCLGEFSGQFLQNFKSKSQIEK